jgi:hypothetical protein
VPNGKYLGRLVGDEYPTRQLEDDPMDEPAGPGGRMLDLNYDTDDGTNYKDGGTSRNNVTRYDYRYSKCCAGIFKQSIGDRNRVYE